MKRYVKATTQPQDLSKERLETIVSEIVNIYNDSTLNSDEQSIKTLKILNYFNLIK